MAKKRRKENIGKDAVEEGQPGESSQGYVNEQDVSNALILPSKRKKRKVEKKDAEGGNAKQLEAKRKRLAAKEAKESKAKKKKLAKILERKAKKQSRESLFESLSQFQLPVSSLANLSATSQMQSKLKKPKSETEPEFPKKLKSLAGGAARSTIHNKPLVQENYYETDSESDSGDEVNVGASTSGVADIVVKSEDTVVVDDESLGNCKDILMPAVEESSSQAGNTADVDSIEPAVGGDADERKTEELLNESKTPDAEKTKNESAAKRFIRRVNKGVSGEREHVFVERSEEVQNQRSKLPIFEEEQSIVEAVNENTSVIICGETGSGKTTQLPQFLYEAGYTSGGKLIGITEPRRVAAISMASRVGYELGRHEAVSYQIRYEGNRTENTRILFMTDGVLMKELQKDILLSAYSVIVIDEAHERSMYSDVLIGLLSRVAPLRASTSNPLKFIIMSATLRLSDFTQRSLFPVAEPPVLRVDSRQFPVTPYFERQTPQNYLQAAFRKVCKIHESKPPGTILVFLSGRREVETLFKWLTARYPIRQESMRRGIARGKKGRSTVVKLEEYAVEEESRKGEDFDEMGVADTAFEDDYEDEMNVMVNELDDSGPLEAPPHDVMPLFCLPLYSLLSTEKQKRVFEPVPENCRGCVIATNVAETSLTIPGVRYVVDSGREKRRLYDPVTGVSKFSVQWISQASADQRMGRAGRVQAGEVYRLFSRQFYADLDKFSEPEILNKPVDQLVLHMKSMNIVKIANFPFPSRPDVDALEEAEKRLIRLGALEVTVKNGTKEARISALGKALSLFPLAPKYAKVLVMAKQSSLLAHACCVVAAFSVREPLIPIHSLKGETNEVTMTKMLEALKQRRGWSGKGQARRLGDVTVLLTAILGAQAQDCTEEACFRFGVRRKALIEARKLRQQLTNLINTSCVLEEPLTLDPHLPPPDDRQSRMLRQIIIASLTENVARRIDRSATEEEIPKGAYECLRLKDHVFIDVGSVLYKEQPDWVLFLEIVEVSGKKCMRDVIAVEPEWLPQLAPSYCQFSTVKNAEPRYDAEKDAVVVEEKCSFGDRQWQLSVVDRPLPNNLTLYRLFARFILDGSVCPPLAQYADKLLASPLTMTKSWAKLQQRTEKFLNMLVKHEVTSKARLQEVWKEHNEFLLDEYLDWLPVALHDTVQLSWPPTEFSKA